MDGDYAFRFWGFDDGARRTDFLIGVGLLTLAKGKITGRHRSTPMPLQNGAPPMVGDIQVQLYPAAFSIEGAYQSRKDGIWEADLTLTSTDPAQAAPSS